MIVYVDSKNRCHTTNPDNRFREVEHPFFDGKCQSFVEGYCYDDGKGYAQIYSWKPYDELETAQREYERQLLAEYAEALKVVGVEV